MKKIFTLFIVLNGVFFSFNLQGETMRVNPIPHELVIGFNYYECEKWNSPKEFLNHYKNDWVKKFHKINSTDHSFIVELKPKYHLLTKIDKGYELNESNRKRLFNFFQNTKFIRYFSNPFTRHDRNGIVRKVYSDGIMLKGFNSENDIFLFLNKYPQFKFKSIRDRRMYKFGYKLIPCVKNRTNFYLFDLFPALHLNTISNSFIMN